MNLKKAKDPDPVCMPAQSVTQSCLTLCDPWTAAHKTPLSMEFSRQEYYSGSPFSTSRDHPNPGIDQASLASPALAGGCFTTGATWEAHCGLSWYKAELIWLSKLLWIHPYSQDAALRVFTRVSVVHKCM